jgi:hypothetical protein
VPVSHRLCDPDAGSPDIPSCSSGGSWSSYGDDSVFQRSWTTSIPYAPNRGLDSERSLSVLSRGLFILNSNILCMLRPVTVMSDIASIIGCSLCGENHAACNQCPCPLCLWVHEGSSCTGDTRCDICGVHHISAACPGAFGRICKFCGNLHPAHKGCPCPRCGYWHEGTCCIDVCALYNTFHADPLPQQHHQ